LMTLSSTTSTRAGDALRRFRQRGLPGAGCAAAAPVPARPARRRATAADAAA
jgi:hypothetical protein